MAHDESPRARPNRRGLAEDYPHFRELLPEVTNNCYTGGVRTLLRRQGTPLSESAIFALGQGFGFRAGLDEYLQPEIGFDLVGTAERFALALGCRLVEHPIVRDRALEQLADLLAGGPGLIAWVNSAFMRYSSLYYTSRGYLHAIVIDGVDRARRMARITDNLIVSVPPLACTADLSFDDLVAGLFERVCTPHVDLMGSVTAVEPPSAGRDVTAREIRAALVGNAGAILSDDAGDAHLRRYAVDVQALLAKASETELVPALRRVNDMVKTLYVLPSRRLLREAVETAWPQRERASPVFACIEEAINAWTTVANLALKASVTLRRREIEGFSARMAAVRDAEAALWRAIQDLGEEA